MGVVPMSQLTDQKLLLENFNMRIAQYGPGRGWPMGKNVYLQCPRCQYYAQTTAYDLCSCGCISIDVDYGRVNVCRDQVENNIAVCYAERKSSWLSLILDFLQLFGQ
jgi:hypothetical protein